MEKVTLQMIADRLNVSRALVSKALSNAQDVNQVTKETIWKTAEEMGYRIKSNKKMTTSENQTGNIAVLMPRAYLDDMEYWGKVIRGIDKELENNGRSMILSSIDISLSPKEGLPTSIYEKKVDGAIVMGHLPDNYISALSVRSFPFVLVDSNFNSRYDHVLANNFQGAYDATVLLLEAGHRRLAFVGDADSSWSFRERKKGFEEAIRVFNLNSGDKATYETVGGIGVSGKGMYITSELNESIHRYIVNDKVTPVTGLCCANDLCAIETLNRLQDCNITCPDDVSMVGFDDLTITELMTPKLSTVSVPKSVIGSRAVQMLLKRIDNPDFIQELLLIATSLIERESVRKLV